MKMVDRIYLKELGIDPLGYKSQERFVWPVGFVGNMRNVVEMCEGDKSRTAHRRWFMPVVMVLDWVQGEGLVGLSEADTAVESVIEIDFSEVDVAVKRIPLEARLQALGIDPEAVYEAAVEGNLDAGLWQKEKIAIKLLEVASDYLSGILSGDLCPDFDTFWRLYGDGFVLAQDPPVLIWRRVRYLIDSQIKVDWEVTQ